MAAKPPIYAPALTQRLQMPQMQTVAANTTATLQLPIGWRYRRLHLLMGGTTMNAALMTKIRLYANNDLFQQISGAQRDMLNQFDRMPAASTYSSLCIPFERIGMGDENSRYLTCIGTGKASKGPQSRTGIETFRMEIDIGAAVAPTIQVWADVLGNNPEQSRALPRIDQWAENVTSTGVWLHQNARRLLNDSLRPVVTRLSFNDTPANITQVQLTKNQNQDLVLMPTTLLQYDQAAELRRTPPAGWVIYDGGDFGEFFNTLDPINYQAFDIRTTHTATNANMAVLAETLGPCSA